MNVSHRQTQDTLQSGSLQIGFHWHRDRFAHSISLVKSDRQLPLLASREGDSEQDWPPSPVLQELHFEDRPAGAVALLVGRTTLAHWSLAITAIGEGFSFDTACRVLGPGDPFPNDVCLRTGYRAMIQPTIQDTSPMVIEVADVLVSCVEDSCLPSLTEGGPEDTAWRLTIVPEISDEMTKTFTWRYTVSFS
jgi:hypothetical protein